MFVLKIAQVELSFVPYSKFCACKLLHIHRLCAKELGMCTSLQLSSFQVNSALTEHKRLWEYAGFRLHCRFGGWLLQHSSVAIENERRSSHMCLTYFEFIWQNLNKIWTMVFNYNGKCVVLLELVEYEISIKEESLKVTSVTELYGNRLSWRQKKRKEGLRKYSILFLFHGIEIKQNFL